MPATQEGFRRGIIPQGFRGCGSARAPTGLWPLSDPGVGDLADRSGLTRRLSAALALLQQPRRRHNRGHVLTHPTVTVGDGATTWSDIAVPRHPPDLWAGLPRPPVWRTLTAEILTRLATARADWIPSPAFLPKPGLGGGLHPASLGLTSPARG
jgi:hypothetical protein